MPIPKIPLWARLTIVSGTLLCIGSVFGVNYIKSSVYGGLIFLVFTLIPIHFRKLARYRRDFGIVSGILITLHGILAFKTLMNASVEKLFHQVIINGYIAAIIIAVLLITSNYGVQRKLRKTWRTIHALVWFVLPLSLLHALMAGRYYMGELPKLAVLLLGGLAIFGIVKIVLPKSSLKENIRDALLVVLGVIFAIGIALLYPVSGESSQNVPTAQTTVTPTTSEILQPTLLYDSTTIVPIIEPTSAPTVAPTSSSQEFTMQDVAQHSSQSDCYVAFQGVVYNITSYLPNHPGGIRKATQMCGQNIDTFSDQHSGGSFSSPQAQEMLVPLEVGKLK